MPITITVLDTGGIQSFIFGSNVLRENIGASELVHRATRLWAFEELDKLETRHNVSVTAAMRDDVQKMYTNDFRAGDNLDEVGAEVLYSGGGNTVILFQGEQHLERAKLFVYHLSCRLLLDAPGLNLFAAHREYEWAKAVEAESLPSIVNEAIKQLGHHKGRDPGSLPALGWPVTAACTSTGLPANGRHPDKEGKTGNASRANRQVEEKWAAADLAAERLTSLFPWVEEAHFQWTANFDDLATLTKRDDSYIAVVHADGNGMGRRIKELTEHWSRKTTDPRGYISAMRALSNQVQDTAVTALKHTMRVLTNQLARDDWEEPRQYARKGDSRFFPVRPIVFGGDDVTLVCAGPWGLAVAQRYLWELEQLLLTEGEDDKPYACAGVAIVKTHYPFSQAYELSEALTKGAKKRADCLAKKKASALDWHLTTTGLHGELDYIRQREYIVSGGQLTMRPLMLCAKGTLNLNGNREEWQTWRNWANLTGLLNVFGEGGSWRERHNKTMRLREALRRGPQAVDEFLIIFEEDETDILRDARFEAPTAPQSGWLLDDDRCLDPRENEVLQEKIGSRCVYFDAIEIADHFFVLPNEQEGA